MIRKLAIVLAIVPALGFATACGGQSGDDGGKVKVVWWHGQTEAEGQTLKDLADEYNKSHPGVVVDPEVGTTNVDEMLQKVQAALAGGEPPDVAYMYGSWSSTLADTPKVVDLSSMVKDPSFGWDDFWPAAREAATVDGKVIGVPSVVDNLGLIYNKKLFDAAGVPYPTKDWTWDDFRTAAKKLTDPGKGVFGTSYVVTGDEDTVWRFWPMVWQQGGSILNSDGKTAAFASPQAVQSLDLWRAMAVDDKSVYLDQNGEKFLPLFYSGKVGMEMAGPWAMRDLADHDVDYGVVPLPGYGGNHQTISGPDNWVVFDNGSKRAQAAKDFLAWLTKPEQDARWSLGSGNLPIRQATSKLPAYKKFAEQFTGADAFLANQDNAMQARPSIAGYPDISAKVGDAIDQVLLGQATAQQALSGAAAEADKILAKG
ncbi:ABC transporter substrate-binding protein [Planotetraspora silvatica]|uniref:ABC transporter substrate-binding protein n=1 Tax=Planotetraspora silvatica TaxID=234614 RepID=A0A8J3UYM3_9ACTN|nr:ABC transporter substrate-binding protein [Planotetraspora silvatica]GII46830.1 ABC transporter substrate-binding protein [Planotetraspora silvatica]